MEELQPEELEGPVREVGGDVGADESLPPEMEESLRVLQSDGMYLARRRAAERLGMLNTSNRQVVLALLEAVESDPIAEVRGMAAESLGAPVHQAILEQYPELGQRAQAAARRPAAARERKKAVAGETAYGRLLGLGAGWGIVNAVLCGLLVVAIVGSLLLGSFGKGDAGMFAAIMLLFFIPIACIPIGISCLAGAVWSGVAMRRHPSRDAQTGLWLSLGGVIAVMACYALVWGILSL